MGIRKLVVESDALCAIHLLQNPLSVDHSLYGIPNDCKTLLDKNWECALLRTLREGNACADFLANLGSQCNNQWSIIFYPPTGILHLLRGDAMGVCFARQ